MGIGVTTGDKPDFVDDGDLKTLDELRGAMQDLTKAKMSLNEKATVQGLTQTVNVLRQQMEMSHEQMRRLIGMYQTLTNEFDQFKAQRVIELQSWVAGGSTTPEDCNAPDT